MVEQLRRKLTVAFLGAFAAGLVCGSAHAQGGGGEQPAMAFGGRMVQGTVTAATADHLTLKTEKGETYTVVVTPGTQVRKGRDQAKFADVHPGDGVGAVGEVDAPNKTVHALALIVVDAEQIRKMKEDLGKTYIAGKITAIIDLKLTILRADGVSQTILVDEDTSFKKGGRGMQAMGGMMGMGGGGMGGGGMGGGGGARQGGSGAGAGGGGGESITLADIKVGDSVLGQGALKNGVFVPKQLNVADPAQPGSGRRRQGGDAAAGPGAPPPNGEPK